MGRRFRRGGLTRLEIVGVEIMDQIMENLIGLAKDFETVIWRAIRYH